MRPEDVPIPPEVQSAAEANATAISPRSEYGQVWEDMVAMYLNGYRRAYAREKTVLAAVCGGRLNAPSR